MAEHPSIAEMIRVAIVLGALVLSIWALIDDVWDLVNVRRYGEVGGPRWVAALEHFWFNATLLVAWLCFLGVVSIAIYLPARADPTQNAWAVVAGWLNLVFGACVFVAQVVRRAGRVNLNRLPLAAWERMLASMVDGMTPDQRASVSAKLLASTTAGREIGHVIANETAPAAGLIDLVLASAVLTNQQRTDLVEALQHISVISDRGAALHAEFKRLGGVA